MNNYKIVVADSSETSRKYICNLLNKKGYKTYQATDGAGVIRITRSIFPDLVIIDTNLWGIKAYEVAKIIENDRLSTVIFATNSPNKSFYEHLNSMNIFAYIIKPINLDQFYNSIEFSIANSNKIKSLQNKIQKLEDTLEARKKIDQAKTLLIKALNLSEDEAYQYLRKLSMDKCKSMDKVSIDIISIYSNKT